MIVFNLLKWFFKGLFETIITLPKYFIKGIIFIFTRKWKKEKFNKIIFILSFIVYLICVFLTSRWIAQNIKLKYLEDDIINSTNIIEKVESEIEDENKIIENDRMSFNLTNQTFIDADLTELKQKNEEVIGWINVLGTKVDYPFVQTSDNEFYLNHNVNRRKTNIGWIFLDYRNDINNLDKNTIIYGHNLTSGGLFGTLPNTLNKKWFDNKDNHYVKISTNDSNSIWQVISVYKIEPETYYIKTKFEDDKYLEFLNIIKSRSIYNFEYVPSTNDKILTLSTCDNTGKRRMVLHAKLKGVQYK